MYFSSVWARITSTLHEDQSDVIDSLPQKEKIVVSLADHKWVSNYDAVYDCKSFPA
jgi:hypothetical protein